MNKPQTQNTILHTEAIKKKYSEVEREIKRRLTELFLLTDIGLQNEGFRGFSITNKFGIRELSPQENSKYLSNPSTIKSPVMSLTVHSIQDGILSIIDKGVTEKEIAQLYKQGVVSYINNLKSRNRNMMLHKSIQTSPMFFGYLKDCNTHNNSERGNLKKQVAKIVFDKFGEDAFELKENEKGLKRIVLSQKSLDYIYIIFCNANKVRESWGKSLDKVFHDGDFPFIVDDIPATESDYLDVILYLIDKEKPTYYGKRGSKGQAEWGKKTAQYADILWALTNDQLMIDKNLPYDGEFSEFQRDDITQNLYKKCGGILKQRVDKYNYYSQSSENTLTLNKRLKRLPSCVEKIIEGKKINDVMGFRISIKGTPDQNFEIIKKVSRERFEDLCVNLNQNPKEYVQDGQTIEIKDATIDNKGMLESEEVDEIISKLNLILPVKKRQYSTSPYIKIDEWEQRIQKYYPELMQDEKKWDTIKSFYKRIALGKARGKNGGYKDFKFNIVFDIKDSTGKSIGERHMELQFDDVNNGMGLANYNIRNFERWLNTQSRLSFSVPLSEVRKICEMHLKKMCQWGIKWTESGRQKKGIKDLFDIQFDDGSVINISQFIRRDPRNTDQMDDAIVKIINYFLQKGTFILCHGDKSNGLDDINLSDGLLTVEDLHDPKKREKIHICSSLELAAQQHSYLQQDWDRKVGIYLEDEHDIGWITLGELINPMNLGKKKDKNFSEEM